MHEVFKRLSRASKRHLLIGGAFLLTFSLLIFKFNNVLLAAFASWGDNSLIHACVNSQGSARIVGPTDSCGQNETQTTWLKDIDVGNGLNISRTSSGATLSLDGSNFQAYEVNPTDGQTTTSPSFGDMTSGTQQITLFQKSIVQVSARANAFLAPLSSFLNISDFTSNGNDLVNNGATEYTADTPFTDSSAAVDLESTESDYLSASDSSSLSITGDMTLELWIKPESTPSSAGLLTKFKFTGSNDRAYLFGLNISGSNRMDFYTSSNGTDQNNANVSWTPSLGTWYHVAVVYDASEGSATFYVNGSQQGTTQTGLHTSVYDSAASFNIGAYNEGSNNFDGVIDEARVWNLIRTGTEINDNKNIELTGTESGLVAYYPLESLGDLAYIRTTYDSGGADTEIGTQGYTNVTSNGQSISAGGVVILNAGTYTIAMQKKVNTSGATATYNQPGMSIIVIPTE